MAAANKAGNKHKLFPKSFYTNFNSKFFKSPIENYLKKSEVSDVLDRMFFIWFFRIFSVTKRL